MLGKVCISTKYPGADEIIKDGENGYLVESNNAVELAEVLAKIFTSPSASKELEDKAILSSKKYELSSVLKLWDEAINSML